MGEIMDMKENATLPCEDCISFPICIVNIKERPHEIFLLVHNCSILNEFIFEDTNVPTLKRAPKYKLMRIKDHFIIPSGILDTHDENMRWAE